MNDLVSQESWARVLRKQIRKTGPVWSSLQSLRTRVKALGMGLPDSLALAESFH